MKFAKNVELDVLSQQAKTCQKFHEGCCDNSCTYFRDEDCIGSFSDSIIVLIGKYADRLEYLKTGVMPIPADLNKRHLQWLASHPRANENLDELSEKALICRQYKSQTCNICPQFMTPKCIGSYPAAAIEIFARYAEEIKKNRNQTIRQNKENKTMTIIEELRNKKSVYNRDLLDRAASTIERLDAENKRYRRKEFEVSPDTVWICVYKDTLGFRDSDENLTMICLPTRWLKATLKDEGIVGFEPWLETYTADETESIVVKAMHEGVIVDFDEEWMRPYFATGCHIFEGKRRDNEEWVYGRLLADNVIVPIGQTFEVENHYVSSDLEAYFVVTDTVSEFPIMYGEKLAVKRSDEEDRVIKLHSVRLDDAGKVIEDVLFTEKSSRKPIA